MNAVEIRNLKFSYSDEPVLDGVDLAVRKGEFVALLGGVGSGKTTLLLTLNGVIPNLIAGNYSGSVTVFGHNTAATSVREMSRKVSFVFQDPNDQLFSETVMREVLFGLENHGMGRDAAQRRARQALLEAGISSLADRDPTTLSQGQKQKVALACAIAARPRLLVLDEPTSSLDHSSAVEIYDVVSRLNRAGTTVVVSEHDTELVARHASRVLLLNEGRISLDGGRRVLGNELLRMLGLKIPCAVEVANELSLGEAYSPEELLKKMVRR